MHTFKEWIDKNHPEFMTEGEGVLQKLHPSTWTGAANAAISAMGVLGRLYTPFLGTSAYVDQTPPQPNQAPAAIMKQLDPKEYSPGRRNKDFPLTGVAPIDVLGSAVGEPMSQAWWDAADWIPDHLHGAADSHKLAREKEAHLYLKRPVAKGQGDPRNRKRLVNPRDIRTISNLIKRNRHGN
jgi:hypothetical protein